MKTVGSLFSGMGGFETGFEQAGFKTLWSVEIEKNCHKVLAKHFPDSKVHDDVTTFNPDDWPCPDFITFGFPCQDLSVAGNRKGIKEGETRSGLFYEATRIISGFVRRGLRFALAENVPGIFSSNGGRDFAAVIGTLGELGALDIGWSTLDCQWFGLAQRRQRVFIVADFRGRCAEEILSLREGLCWHPAPSREAGKGTSATVSASPPSRRNGGSNPTEGHLIAPAIPASGRGFSRTGETRGQDCVIPIQEIGKRQSGTAMNGVGHGEPGDPMFTLQSSAQHRVAHSLRAGSPSLTCNHEAPIVFSSKDYGADAGEICPTLRAGVHDKSHENGGVPTAVAFTERTRKDGRNFETQEELAYALTNPGSGGRTHSRSIATQFAVRRLTPTECLRLMGYADDYLDDLGLSDSAKYRMIGNSVAIPVVRWIAERMAKVIDRQQPNP